TRRCASPGLAVRPGLAVFGDWAGPLDGSDGAGDHGGVDRASRDRWVGSGIFGTLGPRARGSALWRIIRALGCPRTRRSDTGRGIHRRKRLSSRLVSAVGCGVHSLGVGDCLGDADVVSAVPHGRELALEEGDGGAVVSEQQRIVLFALAKGREIGAAVSEQFAVDEVTFQ